MRTSFHHQSEAQSPNGPLTAATSPDTPSPSPTTQSCANPEFSMNARTTGCLLRRAPRVDRGCIRLDRQHRGHEIAQHRGVLRIALGQHLDPRAPVRGQPLPREIAREGLDGDPLRQRLQRPSSPRIGRTRSEPRSALAGIPTPWGGIAGWLKLAQEGNKKEV